jgi:hypothetical protein
MRSNVICRIRRLDSGKALNLIFLFQVKDGVYQGVIAGDVDCERHDADFVKRLTSSWRKADHVG